MAIKDLYFIKQIDYRTAMDVVIKNHYLHRTAPCSIAFGLFEYPDTMSDLFASDRLIGVITYGVSCSSTLLKGICGEEEKSNVY